MPAALGSIVNELPISLLFSIVEDCSVFGSVLLSEVSLSFSESPRDSPKARPPATVKNAAAPITTFPILLLRILLNQFSFFSIVSGEASLVTGSSSDFLSSLATGSVLISLDQASALD